MVSRFVSVCLITYNQSKYIGRAIDSVLSQVVSYSWELIIADDFSTDGTRGILLEYKKRYPEVIRLILQEKNVGPGRNWIDLISTPASKYFAYFEGDDYWIDPLKLQKQIDFLEANPGFTACFHNVQKVDENGNYLGIVYPRNRKQNIGLSDLLKGDYMKSCSLLVLNEKELLGPIFKNEIPPHDTSLGFCLLSNGNKAKYLDECMAAYRVHPNGAWSMVSADARFNSTLQNLLKYRSFFSSNKEASEKFIDMMRRYLAGMIVHYLKSLRPGKAIYVFGLLIRYAR